MEAEECCQICVNGFTKSRRKKIPCPTCGFTCCLECFKQHCLTGGDISCMDPDCRAIFPQKFIRENLTNTFIKGEYSDARKNFLWETEKSLLPMTQPMVDAQIEIENSREKILILKKELNDAIKLEEENIRRQSRILAGQEAGEGMNNQRKTYLSKCPQEGCNGYLNNGYHCSICGNSTCSKCFAIKVKGEEHVCNEDDLKTAELLKKDTKGCPSCGELIHKIYGCDQMYCTSCHTAFSWKTGKILTGVIHNPHYFEYRNRTNGADRDVRDIPCGGLVDFRNLTARVRTYVTDYRPLSIILIDLDRFWRFAAELRDDINNQTVVDQERFNINKDLRIDYMRNKISDEEIQMKLLKKDTDLLKNREILQVYNTLALLIEDQLRNITVLETHDDIKEAINEIKRIIEYGNTIFQDLAKTFKVSMPLIEYPPMQEEDITQNMRALTRQWYYPNNYHMRVKIAKRGNKK